jgi:arginyl-tRNA synthetase
MTFSSLKKQIQTWQPSICAININILWQIPSSPDKGFLTSNLAFQLAKELKQNPAQLAQELQVDLVDFIQKLDLPITVQAVGPYLNLRLNESFWLAFLEQKFDSNSSSDLVTQDSRKVIFEYIGANVAKRLHIGHMRNCNIGDSLRRVLSLKYPNLVTDNHWGDWGVNMGVLLWGWKNYDHSLFGDQTLIQKLSEIYVWANTQKENSADIEVLVREEFLKLEQKDEENTRLWQDFIQTTKKDLQQDLNLLSVPPLQLEQGESFYEPDMTWLTAFMDKHNIWTAEGKARYFDFENLVGKWSQNSDLDSELAKNVAKFGRAYLISSTGYTSYCFRDVAARLQWARDHGGELMISITDKTQKHNFDQAFAVICYLATLPEFEKELTDYLNSNQPLHPELSVTQVTTDQILTRLQWSNLKYIGYGRLNLADGKMSSRKGNVVALRDLFDQVQAAATQVIISKIGDKVISDSDLQNRSNKVTVAALKWNDLKLFYEQDITFDVNQVLKFEGNTGVYQQYTFARLTSVRQKMQINSGFSTDCNNSTLNSQEILILQHIFGLSDCLEQICLKYEPHLLCNYLYELCNQLNKWYNDTPILKDTERAVVLALFLDKALANLEFGLNLLGIDVLSEM